MANNGSMIYGQVQLTDIQAVLPTYFNNVLDIFRQHGDRFRKWARWKPVVWARQYVPRTDMWRCSDGQCGMTIKKYGAVGSRNTPGTFLYDITHNLCEWVYTVPQGGEDAPCRVGDLGQWLGDKPGNLGYINYAESPFGSPDIEMLPSADGSIDFPFEEPDVDDSGNRYTAPEYRDPTTLSPNLDILDFAFNGVWAGEFYFGIALSNGLVFTGSTKIKDGGMGQVTAKGIHLATGTYTCYPFLCSYSRPFGSAEQVGTLIPLDNWSFKLTVRKNGYFYSVVAAGWNSGNRSIWGILQLYNEKYETQSVTNPTVYLYRVQAGRDPGQYGELVQTIRVKTGTVTIPTDSHVDLEFSLGGLTRGNYDWYVTGPRDIYTQLTYYPLEDADEGDGGSDYAPN